MCNIFTFCGVSVASVFNLLFQQKGNIIQVQAITVGKMLALYLKALSKDIQSI